MFTESELKLLDWALDEIVDWLETEEDFKNYDSIRKKLNIEKDLTK